MGSRFRWEADSDRIGWGNTHGLPELDGNRVGRLPGWILRVDRAQPVAAPCDRHHAPLARSVDSFIGRELAAQ